MKGYGIPITIDLENPNETMIELFGLKDTNELIIRKGAAKRAIRKSQKHAERFRTKQTILEDINVLGY